MIQEEKAKAYDEALKRAKAILKVAANEKEAIGYVSTIFPELAESEDKDERIRKALVDALNKNLGNGIEKYGTTLNAALAWLEKQGGKESDPRYENLEELLAADNIYQMSMNDEMVIEAKEKAAKALSELCIGKLLGFEKQGHQEEPQVYETEDGEIITYSETDGYKVVEPHFKACEKFER